MKIWSAILSTVLVTAMQLVQVLQALRYRLF